jgi:cytochrome bd-type quinol oxidase subunit 2
VDLGGGGAERARHRQHPPRHLPGTASVRLHLVGPPSPLTFLFGAALFPNLIVSSTDPAYSLTIYNAASSLKTLGIMRNIAFAGMPFVLTYTVIIYWVFRGKVDLGKFSY